MACLPLLYMCRLGPPNAHHMNETLKVQESVTVEAIYLITISKNPGFPVLFLQDRV